MLPPAVTIPLTEFGFCTVSPQANRAALMIALPGAVQEASSLQDDRKRGQGSIFDILGDAPTSGSAKEGAPRSLPTVDPWPAKDRLMFEKEALGFYFSSHPLAQRRKLTLSDLMGERWALAAPDTYLGELIDRKSVV